MADGYKILAQSPDMELDTVSGRFVNGWKIQWQVTGGTADGTQGITFVPDSQHNAEAVHGIIAAKVADLNKIAQLGGK